MLSFSGKGWTQEVSDSVSANWPNEPCAEGFVTYQYIHLQPQFFLANSQLDMGNDLHFIGFEESYIAKWCRGSAIGVKAHGLIWPSQLIGYNKYKLKGLRVGVRYGYKFNLFNRVIIEPNTNVEYGNFRLLDKTANSRLKNNSFNLGINIDLAIIPYINVVEGVALQIAFSGGYLYKVPNRNWVASKNFDSEISANPFNWSGWYFGFKIGMVDFY